MWGEGHRGTSPPFGISSLLRAFADLNVLAEKLESSGSTLALGAPKLKFRAIEAEGP